MGVINLNYDGLKAAPDFLFQSLAEGLESDGCVVLRGYPFDLTNPEAAGRQLLGLAAKLGAPVPQDSAGKLVWDIKVNPAAAGKVATFSEHSCEACLHTDNQYSNYPEDYMVMLSIRQARCGGGQSNLLALEDILASLRATAEGRRCLQILLTRDYPFVVPTVFNRKPGGALEFVFGRILTENGIRYRADTLQKGLDANPAFKTADRVLAFDFLTRLIENSPGRLAFHLEEGSAIFINNTTMLHGRGAFTDSSRHLLRVRMKRLD